ncbi:MAG: hypothetical protein ACM3SY_09005 [Candidatus Omnitrophota bacterium]
MQILSEIRRINSARITIDIPKEFKKREVLITVSPIEEPETNSSLSKKLHAIDELNGLLSDQNERELNEFDRIISQRITLRKEPIDL